MNSSLFRPLAALVLGSLIVSRVSAEDEAKAKTPGAPAVAEKKSAAASPLEPEKLTEKAPESFKVKFVTTKGDFTIQISRPLSPNGVDRFYNLIQAGYFNDIAFFRVIPGFMGQFGIHGDPKISAAWRSAPVLMDDPVKGSNVRGAITYAKTGAPNSRGTQFFINLGNNPRLDADGFSPFGKVVQGMEVVDKLNGEYGEGAPSGKGPDQSRVQQEGNVYLKKSFPNLDYIKSASVLK